MTDTIKLPSLLPYLQAGPGRFHLVIVPEQADKLSPLEPCRNPFHFRDVPDPFALLGDAGVVSDLTGQMLPLYMLIQRSEYQGDPEDPLLTTNPSVNQRWQHIMSVLSTPPLKALHFLLAAQIGNHGQLLPFHSLFYCRAEQSFFHPPCPGCGRELELCTDNTLLAQQGLEGYTTSLRRFLYCPQCCSTTTTGTYYVVRRRENDPDCVNDIRQLITGWARLEKTAASDTSFPCRGCRNHETCYGSDTLAVNTLCSFSFYPFHMLLLKADSQTRLDFQALLSGKAQPQACLIGGEDATEPVPDKNIADTSALQDAAIHAILTDISTQWETEEYEKKQPPVSTTVRQSSGMSFPPQRECEDLMETVILSSAPVSQEKTESTDNEKRGLVRREADFSLDATVLIAPQFDPAATVRLQSTPSEDPRPIDPSIKNRPEEYLQETIIISAQTGQQRNPLSPSPVSPEKGTETRGGQAPLPEGKPLEDDLAETIIQRPVKKL